MISLISLIASILPLGGVADMARRMREEEEAARKEAKWADPKSLYGPAALGELVYRWLRSIRDRRGTRSLWGRRATPRRSSLSLTGGLVRLAARRLPAALDAIERDRWAEEMAADAAAIPSYFRRLVFAFNLWRKGAPTMPVGAVSAPRSADS